MEFPKNRLTIRSKGTSADTEVLVDGTPLVNCVSFEITRDGTGVNEVKLKLVGVELEYYETDIPPGTP